MNPFQSFEEEQERVFEQLFEEHITPESRHSAKLALKAFFDKGVDFALNTVLSEKR